jgi:hypothetical protein
MSDIANPPAGSAPGPIQAATMDMLRSVLMGAGTPLLARGIVSGDQLGAIIGGLLAAASAIWSYAAAHPSKVGLLTSLRTMIERGGQSKAWNGDVEALASALLPLIEKSIDTQIRARAGILAGPLDTAANAIAKQGVTQAEAELSVPLA